MYDLQRFARIPYVNTQAHAQGPRWKLARPNTSVDALNTAIILCLVGTVGGWRGRNGRRPTICGKSAATKKPRRDSLAADLRRHRDTLANVYWLYITIKYLPLFNLNISRETRKKFSFSLMSDKKNVIFFYWKILKLQSLSTFYTFLIKFETRRNLHHS